MSRSYKKHLCVKTEVKVKSAESDKHKKGEKGKRAWKEIQSV